MDRRLDSLAGRRPRWVAALFAALLVAVVAAVGCAAHQEGEEGAAGVSGAGSRAAAGNAGRLDRSVLADPGRPDEDRAQDAGRKPLEVYEWLGIRPGMTVADMFASGGYNTHLLSRIVGDGGKVYSVMEFYADREVFDGQVYKVDDIKKRIAENGLKNVEVLIKTDELPPGSVDAMVVVRNYHDVEWVFPELKRKDVVAAMFRALKPGGVVGIVDVATDTPGWDKKAHRLNKQVAIDDFTKGGFELAATSDMLANPKDDHSTSGFDAGRHMMDRYLLKFRKPA